MFSHARGPFLLLHCNRGPSTYQKELSQGRPCRRRAQAEDWALLGERRPRVECTESACDRSRSVSAVEDGAHLASSSRDHLRLAVCCRRSSIARAVLHVPCNRRLLLDATRHAQQDCRSTPKYAARVRSAKSPRPHNEKKLSLARLQHVGQSASRL